MSNWHNHLNPQSDQVERYGLAQLWGHRNSSSMSSSLLLDTQPRHACPLLTKWLRKAHTPPLGLLGSSRTRFYISVIKTPLW